jgi:hypothetical protein
MADIRSLNIYAGVHQVFDNRFYRMTCRTFPYSIYYLIEGSVIKVYAVLDDRRDPEWIHRRLS